MKSESCPDPEELRERVRSIVRRKIAPRAAEYDRTGLFPRDNFVTLAEEGLLGLLIPQAYGGLGADLSTYVAVVEELARGCGSTSLIFAMHCGATGVIANAGDAVQKADLLPKVIEQGKLFAWAFSEPGTGGNILRPQLSSRIDPGVDSFVLEGSKSFCTAAGQADYYVVNAHATGSEKFSDSQSIFVVEAETPGMQIRESWDSLGMRANCANDLIFERMIVPLRACVGGVGGGINALTRSIAPLVLGLAATSLGVGTAAATFARAHVTRRVVEPSGRNLAAFQAVRFMIADLALAEHLARLSLVHAANSRSEDVLESLVLMNMAKYTCNKNAVEMTATAMQLCGAQGYQRRHPLERYFRDSRAGAIMGANLEALRDMIGKASLGIDPRQMD